MKRALLVLALFCAACPLSAQQVGDPVLVTAAEKADLKMGDRVVGKVDRGATLTIEEVKPGSFRVSGKDADGWIDKKDVLPVDEAIRFFTAAIEKKPAANDYRGRGNAWNCKKEMEKALADYSETIRLAPNDCRGYYNRAGIWLAKTQYDKAVADYTEALRLHPKDADAYIKRGRAYGAKRDWDKAISDLSEAIRLDPNNPAAYGSRAWIHRQKGDLAKAIADLDLAIKAQPDAPCKYEFRAAWSLERGDYDRAIADLQTAVRLNPKDQAAKFEPWPKSKLSADDLKHGQQQVRQMLKDRPAMAKYGDKADWLYQWAARKFAGEDLGQRIFWNPSDPGAFEGDNHGPTPDQPGCIRVRSRYGAGPEKGKECSFDQLWSTAVFELYNIIGTPDFQKLDREAAEGKLTKEQFVTKLIEVESLAAEKTRAFFIHVYLPWVKDHRVSSSAQEWYLAARTDPSQNLVLSRIDRTGPYWRNYELGYDQMVLYSLLEKGECDKVISLTQDRKKGCRTTEDKVVVYCARARAYRAKGELDKAIVDLTEAIRLDPNSSLAYSERGCAYARQGDLDRAIADFSAALRVNPQDTWTLKSRAYAYQQKSNADLAEIARLIPPAPAAPSTGLQAAPYSAYGGSDKSYAAPYSAYGGSDKSYAAPYSAYGGSDKSYAAPYSAYGGSDKPYAAPNSGYGGSDKPYHESPPRSEGPSLPVPSLPAAKDSEKNADACCGRGDEYARKGQFDKAIAAYDEAIRLRPTDAKAYYGRALANAEKGDNPQAENDFGRATELGLERGKLEERNRIVLSFGGQLYSTAPATGKVYTRIRNEWSYMGQGVLVNGDLIVAPPGTVITTKEGNTITIPPAR